MVTYCRDRENDELDLRELALVGAPQKKSSRGVTALKKWWVQ